VDLYALHLDVRQRKGRVRATDGTRVLEEELGGAAFARLYAAAQPLFDWAPAHLPASTRTPADATLVAVEVDALARTVRLGYVAEHGPPSSPSGQSPSGSTPVPELSFCSGDYRALQLLLREPARTALRELRPRQPDPEGLTPSTRWEYLYQHGGDGWELGRVPPPLADCLHAHPPERGQRAIVLGCGRGHEALMLAQAGAAVGAHVVAVDIAPSAVRHLQAAADSAGVAAHLRALQADLFALITDDPSHRGAYDLCLEHCCFCAIEPARRDEYVATAAAFLRPGGRLVGLFYCHDSPGGPPYAASFDEVRSRLGAAFTVDSAVVPDNSILTRAGQELLVTATRR
jgi:SAM-dependent methyltransferase